MVSSLFLIVSQLDNQFIAEDTSYCLFFFFRKFIISELVIAKKIKLILVTAFKLNQLYT